MGEIILDIELKYVREIIETVNKIEGLYDLGSKWRGIKSNTLYLLYALNDDKIHTQKTLQKDWLFQRSTLNTIIKECKEEGYISLKPIKGKKRELEVKLTPMGLKFARDTLTPIHLAEKEAMKKTIQMSSKEFITGIRIFADNLQDAFNKSQIK